MSYFNNIHSIGLKVKAPFHLTLYALLFGASVFHSFVVSPIAYMNLDKSAFGTLQNKVFPVYFLGQTISPILLALTGSSRMCPFSLAVLAASSLGGAVNYFIEMSKCRQIMAERENLVKNLKEKKLDPEESPEKKALDKKFKIHHRISSIANILSILSLIAYGNVLSKKIIL